ncbi:hypothetical protein CCMA1212_008721 [Trichoderma ghanense]|uniref:SSCRP protein n=1 Tax=Trichoderma ghanense TaxID=65468 RepID=A0ABY2GVM2_9HYPO
MELQTLLALAYSALSFSMNYVLITVRADAECGNDDFGLSCCFGARCYEAAGQQQQVATRLVLQRNESSQGYASAHCSPFSSSFTLIRLDSPSLLFSSSWQSYAACMEPTRTSPTSRAPYRVQIIQGACDLSSSACGLWPVGASTMQCDTYGASSQARGRAGEGALESYWFHVDGTS